jgi:leucyl-tRNA synthetase
MGKQDQLIELEKEYQTKWQEERLFEVSAPSPDELKGLSPAEVREKYSKWFHYPYMNGSLYLGHTFTISKVEFTAGYQRLLGKRVLFLHNGHADQGEWS